MSDVFEQVESSYLRISVWEEREPSLIVGLTTRLGGYSLSPYNRLNIGLHVQDEYENVIKNREKIAIDLNIPMDYWVQAEQTHGINVHVVHRQDKGKGAYHYETAIKDVDGLITNEIGLLCSAYFADCVPLYFFDPATHYIGIAHAGWKGTTRGIARQMIKEMRRLGVKLEQLLVTIGPAISQEYYEVDEYVASQVNPKYRDQVIVNSGPNKYQLDLQQLNRQICLDCGLPDEHINVTRYCTYQEQELFYSYRRDDGQTGRMLGFIGFQN